MKLNGSPQQYMPLSHSVSDDEETLAITHQKSFQEKNGIINGCTKNIKESSNDIEEPSIKKSMSPLRRICFAFSLLLCIFFIILFIWIMPCQLPPSEISNSTEKWSVGLIT